MSSVFLILHKKPRDCSRGFLVEFKKLHLNLYNVADKITQNYFYEAIKNLSETNVESKIKIHLNFLEGLISLGKNVGFSNKTVHTILNYIIKRIFI